MFSKCFKFVTNTGKGKPKEEQSSKQVAGGCLDSRCSKRTLLLNIEYTKSRLHNLLPGTFLCILLGACCWIKINYVEAHKWILVWNAKHTHTNIHNCDCLTTRWIYDYIMAGVFVFPRKGLIHLLHRNFSHVWTSVITCTVGNQFFNFFCQSSLYTSQHQANGSCLDNACP